MTKSDKLVEKSHKNVNLDDKKPQTSVKKSQKCNLSDKKSEASVKKTQKCKFR